MQGCCQALQAGESHFSSNWAEDGLNIRNIISLRNIIVLKMTKRIISIPMVLRNGVKKLKQIFNIFANFQLEGGCWHQEWRPEECGSWHPRILLDFHFSRLSTSPFKISFKCRAFLETFYIYARLSSSAFKMSRLTFKIFAILSNVPAFC